MGPQGHGWASHPAHGFSQSHDTVDTGVSYGTSGSEPWGNSTDPSSENSSIERAYNMNGYKPEYGDTYAGQYRRESPRHDPIQEEYGFDGNGYTQGQWNGPSSPPPPPPRHSGQYGPPRPMGQPTGQPMGQPMGLPPVPYHQPQQQRNVIPLNSGPGSAPQGPAPPKHGSQPQRQVLRKESNSGEGKRKSWLRRRFSKG